MVTEMLNGFERRVDELSRNNNEIENIKKEPELKNITEMNNGLEGINRKLKDTEEQISNLVDMEMESIQAEHQKNIFFKWGYMKHPLEEYQVY